MSNPWFHGISHGTSVEGQQDVVDPELLWYEPPTPVKKRKSVTRRRSVNLSLADALIDHCLEC